LQQLEKHVLADCKFSKKTQKNKSSKKIYEKVIDAKIMDTINEHSVKGSLEARILAKTDSVKDNLGAVDGSESHKNSREMRERSHNKKEEKSGKHEESNFDFLSTLFD
jgi:hypothetical protein